MKQEIKCGFFEEFGVRWAGDGCVPSRNSWGVELFFCFLFLHFVKLWGDSEY